MEDLARKKNTRGPNRDIWALIYAEMDKKAGVGMLSVNGKQAFRRYTHRGR